MFKWERKKKKHKNSSQGVLTRICLRIIENHMGVGGGRGVWTDNGGAELSDGFLWISSKLRCSTTVTANPHTAHTGPGIKAHYSG